MFGRRKKQARVLLDLAGRVQATLSAMFADVGEPEPGSALEQVGLRDGRSIVEDYVQHGEFGLAVEHLLYMIVEPEIRLSAVDYDAMQGVCQCFGVSSEGMPLPEGLEP